MNFHKYAFLYLIFLIFLYSRDYNRVYYNFINDSQSIDSHFNYSFSEFQNNNFKHGILFKYTYMSSLIDYSQYFYDKNNIYFLYSYNTQINENWNSSFSLYAENSKKKAREDYFEYWNDNYGGGSADVEKAYITYNDDVFFIKLGRDYFHPGHYSFNRILFSSRGSSFDQLLFGFKKKNISISSFYLSLSPHPIPLGPTSIDTTRHLNGHRLNYKFKNGYMAINELILYGGSYKSINLALLNPLLPYYVYHKNHRRFPSNSILSFEYYYRNNTLSLFFEFVLDDLQIDNKEPSDLEPNEYGFILELEKKLNDKYVYTINYLMVSNRTFNAPRFAYEKYVHKNLPMGHFLGNNFWNINLGIKTSHKRGFGGIQFSYLLKGDEALYSEFNEDFLDYTIEDGYNEAFPFGDNRLMKGFIIDINYELLYNFEINSSISYWFESMYDNLGANYLLSVNYKINK